MSTDKISTRAMTGLVVGIMATLSTIIRYYIIYQDYHNLSIFGGLGVLITAFSWLYHRLEVESGKIRKIEDDLFQLEGVIEDLRSIR